MGSYEYFKLKPDSKYSNTTIDECDKKEMYGNSCIDYESELVATMVQLYYEENIRKKINIIKTLVNLVAEQNHSDYTAVKEILKDENQELSVRNCKSEYEIEMIISEYPEILDRIVTNLVVLSTIRFEADNQYVDTPKSTMEYLRYNYVNDIVQEIDYIKEVSNEYHLYKFLSEHCEKVVMEDEE